MTMLSAAGAQPVSVGRGSVRLAYFCFAVAALAGIAGMSLGIWMGLNEDFTLAPVHAHVNLLGWVTTCLYGLYHGQVPRRSNRLAWIQVICGCAGFVLMTSGLALLLSGLADWAFAVVAGGSLLAFVSMVLFLAILVLDLR
jgi:hypothetical protein